VTPQELDERVRVFKRRSLPAVLLMVIGSLVFLASVVVYLLNSRHPSFWPIAVGIFGGAILMSLLLTRLINRASVRAKLICPRCGAPLGGYVKALQRGTTGCPKCGQSVVDSV
jgi:ribosomal protein S27AE